MKDRNMEKIKNIFKLLILSCGIILGLNTYAYDPVEVYQESFEHVYGYYDLNQNVCPHKVIFINVYDEPAHSTLLQITHRELSYVLTWQTHALPHVYDDMPTFVFSKNFLAPKSNTFPSSADEMSDIIGQPKKVGLTPDGTKRTTWEPNANTRIRHESHPDGLRPGDQAYNPRHHGEHFHVEIKPGGVSWNQAKKQGKITKSKPNGYTPGSGTGFKPGEPFPGQ